MKTRIIIAAFAFFTGFSAFGQAKQPLAGNTKGPNPGSEYRGGHGPLYNGTINDPSIVPRKAVPVGSLKGIKRNLTEQEITGSDADGSRMEMMSGDDMQKGRIMESVFKCKSNKAKNKDRT